LEMLKQVDFLKKNLNEDQAHDLLYQMNSKIYEDGQLIIQQDQTVSSIMFIEYGTVEVYTCFEEHEFILDRLHEGTVINALAYLVEDQMYVSIRSKGQTKILELGNDLLAQFMTEHKNIKLEIWKLQNNLFSTEKKYPLDYIIKIPLLYVPRRWKHTHYQEMLNRRNTLKNVVFRIIIEIRTKMKSGRLK